MRGRSSHWFAALVCGSCAAPLPSTVASAPVSAAEPELLPIVRLWCGEAPSQDASWFAEAHDLAGWRALRARLGPDAAALPDAWGSGAGVRVVAVVAAAGAHTADPVPRTASEEGVDALTLRAVAQRGPLRSPAWLVVVPDRPHQLAVILATPRAGLPVPQEAFLGVLDPR